MNVSLPPELEALLLEKVKSGVYDSPGEVIREGLRLLKEHDESSRLRLEALRRDVQLAAAQVEKGEFSQFDSAEELLTEIKRRASLAPAVSADTVQRRDGA